MRVFISKQWGALVASVASGSMLESTERISDNWISWESKWFRNSALTGWMIRCNVCNLRLLIQPGFYLLKVNRFWPTFCSDPENISDSTSDVLRSGNKEREGYDGKRYPLLLFDRSVVTLFRRAPVIPPSPPSDFLLSVFSLYPRSTCYCKYRISSNKYSLLLTRASKAYLEVSVACWILK